MDWPEEFHELRRGEECLVVWRGRHVVEPTELSGEEAELLGNSLPHLHTHVVPRYADDPKPGWPLPFPDEPGQVEEQQFRADVEALGG